MSSSILLKPPLYAKETSSEEETLDLARRLGGLLRPGDWVALLGDLGAGKTVFVRGLGEALHIQEIPRSPTFNLIQVHRPKPGPGRFPLNHVDLYRLTPREIPSLEWEDLMNGEGVTVVEWAEKAQSLWPAQCLPVRITHQGSQARLISFYAFGQRAEELVRKLKQKG